MDYLIKCGEDKVDEVSIMQISKDTSIMAEDIIFAFNQLGLLKIVDGRYFIACDGGVLQALAKKHPVKKSALVYDEKLRWTPYVCDEIVKLKRDKFSVHNKIPVDGSDRIRSVNADFNGRTNR